MGTAPHCSPDDSTGSGAGGSGEPRPRPGGAAQAGAVAHARRRVAQLRRSDVPSEPAPPHPRRSPRQPCHGRAALEADQDQDRRREAVSARGAGEGAAAVAGRRLGRPRGVPRGPAESGLGRAAGSAGRRARPRPSGASPGRAEELPETLRALPAVPTAGPGSGWRCCRGVLGCRGVPAGGPGTSCAVAAGFFPSRTALRNRPFFPETTVEAAGGWVGVCRSVSLVILRAEGSHAAPSVCRAVSSDTLPRHDVSPISPKQLLNGLFLIRRFTPQSRW